MVFEWAVDVLKRTKNVDDKNDIIAQVASTNVETIDGPVDFTTGCRRPGRHPSGAERRAHAALGRPVAAVSESGPST